VKCDDALFTAKRQGCDDEALALLSTTTLISTARVRFEEGEHKMEAGDESWYVPVNC